MNIERLYLVVQSLETTIEVNEIQTHIQAVITGINNQIASPSEGHLQQISNALEALKESIEDSQLTKIPRTWMTVINEIGADYLLGLNLYNYIKEAISGSQPLLNEALTNIQILNKKITRFRQAATELHSAMSKLDIPIQNLDVGEVELSVVFPREIFSNELKGFIKEAGLIDRLIETASEIETGQVEHAEIRQMSTSDPTIILAATPATVLFVLTCIHRILDAYEKVQKIRQVKAAAEIAELEASLITKIVQSAEETIEKELKSFSHTAVKKVKNEARKHELESKLFLTLKGIAARIDRGMQIEGAAEHTESKDEDGQEKPTQAIFAKIEAVAEKIRYFTPDDKPILGLPAPNSEDEEV